MDPNNADEPEKKEEEVKKDQNTTGDEDKPQITDDNEEDEDGLESGEEVVTMLDVLKEEAELENNADAVLGASDENQCTYHQGHLYRQALYACKTCNEKLGDGGTKNGICLACCYKCHDGHELYELYTKRNFRCDCGVSGKFPDGFKCCLIPEKRSRNEDNRYNQNFDGKYCVCHRPYPDPDHDDDDEMIQCVVCEDWFHSKHLETELPENNDYSEMICRECMDKLPFLWTYYEGSVTKKSRPSVSEEKVETSDEPEVKSESTPADSGVDSCSETSEDSGSSGCKLDTIPKKSGVSKGAAFWEEGWRKKLCTCVKCTKKFEDSSCSFLLDETDTVHYYEEKGREKRISGSLMERGLSAFSKNTPRTQQIELACGMNRMKEAFKEFFRPFAERNQVVTPQDVQRFMEEFKKSEAKQPKIDLSSCR